MIRHNALRLELELYSNNRFYIFISVDSRGYPSCLSYSGMADAEAWECEGVGVMSVRFAAAVAVN